MVVAGDQDQLLPSGDEAIRLTLRLPRAFNIRLKEHNHSLLAHSAVDLLGLMASSGFLVSGPLTQIHFKFYRRLLWCSSVVSWWLVLRKIGWLQKAQKLGMLSVAELHFLFSFLVVDNVIFLDLVDMLYLALLSLGR